MPAIPVDIDTSEYADIRSVIPVFGPGKVLAHATSSAVQDTKNGGQMLTYDFTILDGRWKGVVLTTRMNLVNKSADAVRIAKQELATLVRAIYKQDANMAGQPSEVLHHKPVLLEVAVEPPKTANGKSYKARTEIVNYHPYNQGDELPPDPEEYMGPVSVEAAESPVPQAPTPGGATPPAPPSPAAPPPPPASEGAAQPPAQQPATQPPAPTTGGVAPPPMPGAGDESNGPGW